MGGWVGGLLMSWSNEYMGGWVGGWLTFGHHASEVLGTHNGEEVAFDGAIQGGENDVLSVGWVGG